MTYRLAHLNSIDLDAFDLDARADDSRAIVKRMQARETRTEKHRNPTPGSMYLHSVVAPGTDIIATMRKTWFREFYQG
jgi:hypothetical protein